MRLGEDVDAVFSAEGDFRLNVDFGRPRRCYGASFAPTPCTSATGWIGTPRTAPAVPNRSSKPCEFRPDAVNQAEAKRVGQVVVWTVMILFYTCRVSFPDSRSVCVLAATSRVVNFRMAITERLSGMGISISRR